MREGLSIGEAIEAMRNGRRVARQGCPSVVVIGSDFGSATSSSTMGFTTLRSSPSLCAGR